MIVYKNILPLICGGISSYLRITEWNTDEAVDCC